MKLFTNAQIATLSDRHDFGLISHGAIAVDGEKISWVGNMQDIPAEYSAAEVIDFEGRLVTPCLLYTSPSPRDS